MSVRGQIHRLNGIVGHFYNAGLTAAAAITPRLLKSGFIIPPAPVNALFLDCVSSSSSGFGAAQQIDVYRVQNGTWHPLNRPITCEAPKSLKMHPTHSVIYAAHDTHEYLGLPRASISAFAIDRTPAAWGPRMHFPPE